MAANREIDFMLGEWSALDLRQIVLCPDASHYPLPGDFILYLMPRIHGNISLPQNMP